MRRSRGCPLSRESKKLHVVAPHPEEFAAGGRLEGCADLRFDSSRSNSKSPRMSASFLARLQFFSLRSFSIASVIRSNHCVKINSTGRRDAVYPWNVPAMCWAILLSESPGASNVVAPVRTSQDLEPSPIAHSCTAHPSRRGERAAPQDEARVWRVNSKRDVARMSGATSGRGPASRFAHAGYESWLVLPMS